MTLVFTSILNLVTISPTLIKIRKPGAQNDGAHRHLVFLLLAQVGPSCCEEKRAELARCWQGGSHPCLHVVGFVRIYCISSVCVFREQLQVLAFKELGFKIAFFFFLISMLYCTWEIERKHWRFKRMRGLSQSLELQLSNANLALSDLIDVCSK